MVELTITMTLLIIGALGFSQLVLSARRSGETRREQTLAIQAAREVLEQMKAAPFDEVFRRYNGDPGDDPGPDSPGEDFAVRSLRVRPGDLDGVAGEVVFPVDNAVPGVLREDRQDVLLGTPLDLNGDGVVDALDHSGDYEILPVLVRVRWVSPSGPSEIAFRTILTDF
jgi:type II secretory pathway pseudopilin PulG